MNIQINDDLTAVLTTDDGTRECRLPAYNPETLVPFTSREEVEAYAVTVDGRPFFFTAKPAASAST